MAETVAPQNWDWAKRLCHVNVYLRPPQIEHLRYISKWDDVSLTRAFLSLLEAHASSKAAIPPGPTVPAHFALNSEHISLLDALALQWGMPRTETVRRVIDMAMATERQTELRRSRT